MFHYFQNLSPDDHHFDDFFHSQKSNACLISDISDYDLCGQGDIFEVPEPTMEQPFVTLDHMTSAMSMILCGEQVISQDIESLQNEDFMSNILYEYKDMFSNEPTSPSRVLNSNSIILNENLQPPGKIIKSMSSDSLNVDGAHIRPSSMSFTEKELKKDHGMRRAFSEGYIKPQLTNDHTTETRMQKLSRYRDKKTKRNFGRKIKKRKCACLLLLEIEKGPTSHKLPYKLKYACRKALADGQPRIKGRFAKTEEIGVFRK